MKAKGYIGIVAVIAALAALVAFLGRSDTSLTQGGDATKNGIQQAAPLDTDRIAKLWPQLIHAASGGAAGSLKAPYTFVEVGDFQCPICGKAEPLVTAMISESHGQAKIYFVNYPIVQLHPHAMVAAEAGLSAAAQGKFWPMYQILYSHQDELIPSEIVYNAKSVPGLDWQKMQSDLDSNKYAPTVAQSISLSRAAGVVSTPTLLMRDPKGKISVFVGTKGTSSEPGLISLAAAPPWGGGMGVAAATAMVSKDQDL